MGAVEVRNEGPDLLDQARPLQQLKTERARGGVQRGHQEQAALGVAGDDAGQQIEIIIDDGRQDRLRGDVYDAGARLTQEQQQE